MGNAKGQISAPVLVVAAAVGLLYLGGEAIKNHVVLPTVHFVEKVFHHKKKPTPVPAPARIANCSGGVIFDGATGTILKCLEFDGPANEPVGAVGPVGPVGVLKP